MTDKELKHGQKSSDKHTSMGRYIWCDYCQEWVPTKVWYLHKNGDICNRPD